jgi:predicted O-methyltransferase YrrM
MFRLNKAYEGPTYKRPREWWLPLVHIPRTTSVRYLEIGVFYGIHLFEVAAAFPNAQLYGIDPWMDYDSYTEYKGQQNIILDGFRRNLSRCPDKSRIQAYRGFSSDIVPMFQNDFFDIVYVDGNHETEYVYKDAHMSFEKTKSSGYIVFDDSDWPETLAGIQRFETDMKERIELIADIHFQRIYRKL